MSIKEELEKLKKQLLRQVNINTNINNEKNNEDFEQVISLDSKVDDFIKWHYENIAYNPSKKPYKKECESYESKDLRNLIEKMAVWYELRYDDDTVEEIIDGKKAYNHFHMFKDNPYIDEVFSFAKEEALKNLNWTEFYNIKVFIKSLSSDERYIFSKPRYPDTVYFDSMKSAHLHLTKNGYVDMTEGIYSLPRKDKNKDIDMTKNEGHILEGMHIKDVLRYINDNKIYLPKGNDIEKVIKEYNDKVYRKEEFLNCVMYRIIERGNTRTGPRRGFIFAKEFDRNIDIPMKYGIDNSDPYLRNFTNEYIKAGGSMDLICYNDSYFGRNENNKIAKTIPLREIYKYKHFTDEERAMHQKLIDILNSQVDYDVVKETETKRKRLERKLQKVNKNKQD